jgi:hypothetical protein
MYVGMKAALPLRDGIMPEPPHWIRGRLGFNLPPFGGKQ